MQLRRLSDQIFDVVRLGKGIVLRAACKSWLARVSQSRTSSRAASSIQFATLGEHLVKQGSPQVFVAVNLSARGNEHVLGKTQTTQTAVRPLHPPDGLFTAVADNDHQVHITVVSGHAPSV